jgi:hypothetical protein
MNQKEAARRQKVIRDTITGMVEIFTTNLHQEMDALQEVQMMQMLDLGEKWARSEL